MTEEIKQICFIGAINISVTLLQTFLDLCYGVGGHFSVRGFKVSKLLTNEIF